MSEIVGKQLGNFIGKFIEYDTNNNAVAWRSYMRLCVAIDVRNPLKRCKKIRKQGGDWFVVNFKYERLNSFCFLCGRLGHTERFCDTLFISAGGEIKREWGAWLRAPDRRNSNLGGDRWLRDDNVRGDVGDFSSGEPAAGNGVQYVAVQNSNSNHSSLISGKLKAVTLEQSYEDIMHESRAGIVGHSKYANVTNDVDLNEEDIGLDLPEDKKRRRANFLEGTQIQNMVLGIGDNENNPNVSFLSAGPGSQACRDP